MLNNEQSAGTAKTMIYTTILHDHHAKYRGILKNHIAKLKI